jgi:hypothetical protein
MKSLLIFVFLLGASLCAAAQTTCSSFPCVVASVSLANQTANIPATDLYTPSTSGVFLVSSNISCSTGTVKGAEWETYEGWTDAFGPRTGAYLYCGMNTSAGQSLLVPAVAGQPIRYEVRLATHGGSGGLTYNLNIVVQQLQ